MLSSLDQISDPTKLFSDISLIFFADVRQTHLHGESKLAPSIVVESKTEPNSGGGEGGG